MPNDRNNILRIYFQPAFLICAAVLAIAGTGMSVAVKSFGLYLSKESLPLKKSLELLNEDALTPYKVVSKEKIAYNEIVETLGTEDYIQWMLRDPNVPVGKPVRNCLLFITYYKLPDQVPHVPEICYLGGGYQQLVSESVVFEINRATGKEKIPGRYIVFTNPNPAYLRPAEKLVVLYLFNVNGVYADSRQNARLVLNKNIFGKYSYFCKVELVFKFTVPAKQEAIMAGQRLLSVVLPVLEAEHWPKLDW